MPLVTFQFAISSVSDEIPLRAFCQSPEEIAFAALEILKYVSWYSRIRNLYCCRVCENCAIDSTICGISTTGIDAKAFSDTLCIIIATISTFFTFFICSLSNVAVFFLLTSEVTNS